MVVDFNQEAQAEKLSAAVFRLKKSSLLFLTPLSFPSLQSLLLKTEQILPAPTTLKLEFEEAVFWSDEAIERVPALVHLVSELLEPQFQFGRSPPHKVELRATELPI